MMSAPASRCPGCFVPIHPQSALCTTCATHERVDIALWRGTTLAGGRYTLGDPLGQPGGFGITYLAWDRMLERRVAVKEFFPRFLSPFRDGQGTVSISGPTGAEQFQIFLSGFLDEGKRAAQIGHEHVVRILDFLEAFGTGYLIMPYYEGETLAAYHDRCGNGPIPWRQALAILLPIVDALHAVHGAGIIHRDVKPDNIYLVRVADGPPQPILIDFGAARIAGSAREFTRILTERYAPLEQYDGESSAQGPWTDVYAIAATCVELLAGQRVPPAPSRQFGAAVPDIADAQPGVPPQLVQCLGDALELNPADRTPDARALWTQLQQVLGTSAPPTAAVSLRTLARPAAETRITLEPGTSRLHARWLKIAVAALAVGGLAAAAALATPFFASSATSTDRSDVAPRPSERESPRPRVLDTAPPPHSPSVKLAGSEVDAARRHPKPDAHARTRSEADSAEQLLAAGDYTNAWNHAQRAHSEALLKRIGEACRQDSLIVARRDVAISCPR